MNKAEYAEYLQSDHWFNFSSRVKGMRQRCEGCGISQKESYRIYKADLHVHHVTYENLGHEKMADVKLLCHMCHLGKEHGQYDWMMLCAMKAMPSVDYFHRVCDRCGMQIPGRCYDIEAIKEAAFCDTCYCTAYDYRE